MSVFTGTSGNDTADAVSGTLKGFSGGSVTELQDNLADLFNGGGGNDTIRAANEDDVLFGGEGSDSLDGGAGDDFIRGGDSFTHDGGDGVDTIFGGEGDDTIFVGSGELIDDINGGGGNDTLDLITIDSAARIQLDGTWQVAGGGGARSISSIENVRGTDANDTISGNEVENVLEGNDGNDVINGGLSIDVLRGGFGNDTIIAGAGGVTDEVDGGSGIDTLDLRSVTNADVRINLFEGGWTLVFDSPFVPISGIERVIGTAHGDRITGADVKETFIGGKGADELDGRGGADRFDFNAVGESGTTAQSRDIIRGFTHGADNIDLSTIDAREGASGNQAFTFIGKAAFTAAGQVRAVQVGDDTVIQINTSGANGAEMAIELSNFNANTLTAGDFIL